jgi:hypothetical protein
MKTGSFRDIFFYTTTITNDSITVVHSTKDGPRIESIRKEEISIIKAKYNDVGLLMPDRWLVLEGEGQICSIPRGGEAERIIFNKYYETDGFDGENYDKSLELEKNNTEFIIWTKPVDVLKKPGRLESKIITLVMLLSAISKIFWNGIFVSIVFLVFLMELFSVGAAIYGLIIGDLVLSLSSFAAFIFFTIILIYVRFFDLIKNIFKKVRLNK